MDNSEKKTTLKKASIYPLFIRTDASLVLLSPHIFQMKGVEGGEGGGAPHISKFYRINTKIH